VSALGLVLSGFVRGLGVGGILAEAFGLAISYSLVGLIKCILLFTVWRYNPWIVSLEVYGV